MKYIKLSLIFFLPILAIFLCSFTETDDFFRYEINDAGEVEIIAFAGEKFSNNIKIPSEIDGYPVKIVKEGAFYNNPYIKTLVIPSSIEMIEDSAFAYCESLEKITFENGEDPIIISEVAFEMCISLKNIEFSNRDTYIDDYVFKDCWSLGNVYFPASVTHIGYLAFSGCENVIFDCEDCPLALEYAEEHNIPTDFLQSDNFLIIAVLSSSVIIFIIIVIVYKLLRKKKKIKN